MDYVKSFMESAESFGWYSKNTLKNYGITYRQFKESLGDKELTEVTRMDLEAFINRLKEKNGGSISPATINAKLGALDSLYSYLIKNDIIESNPVAKVERSKVSKKQLVVLNQEEIDKMIDHCDNKRDKAIIAIMFTSACRISELVNLDKTDIYQLPRSVDAEGMRIHVRGGKGEKDRMVFVPMSYFKYLHEYLESRDDDIDALFISNRKKRIHQTTVGEMLKKVKKKVGLRRKITPHTLRRTCLTFLINNGVDILTVSKQAGHADVSVTDRGYIKYADNQRAKSTLSAWEE